MQYFLGQMAEHTWRTILTSSGGQAICCVLHMLGIFLLTMALFFYKEMSFELNLIFVRN